MGNRLEEQLAAIKYYRTIQSTREGRDIGEEEAAKRFIQNYAEEYARIWYEGISREDLRIKLFYRER